MVGKSCHAILHKYFYRALKLLKAEPLLKTEVSENILKIFDQNPKVLKNAVVNGLDVAKKRNLSALK